MTHRQRTRHWLGEKGTQYWKANFYRCRRSPAVPRYLNPSRVRKRGIQKGELWNSLIVSGKPESSKSAGSNISETSDAMQLVKVPNRLFSTSSNQRLLEAAKPKRWHLQKIHLLSFSIIFCFGGISRTISWWNGVITLWRASRFSCGMLTLSCSCSR